MSRAKGVVQKFEPTQVAGIDTRVWQDKGSSTDNRGVEFTLRGEVATSLGIRPLVRLWVRQGDDTSTPFNPLQGKVTSIGTFTRDGRTDILVECNGDILLLEGSDVKKLLSGRHIPESLDEATRFVQVGTNLIITNGRDPNVKWDGEKVTPLGIAVSPGEPRLVGPTDGETDINTAVSAPANRFWGGFSMTKGDVNYQYRYKVSFVSEFGQESELSSASNMMQDNSVAANNRYMILVAGLESPCPQDDIIGRNLYRSTDSIKYYKLRYLPGTDGDHYIDHTEPAAPLTLAAEDVGQNLPPPLSRFSFYYRGRTYYGGNEEEPNTLFFSKDKGAKEAVPAENFIIVGNNVSDPITGYAHGGDYVLIFKARSTYMLTQDKSGLPILNPLSNSIGAVSDRAAAGFEGRVYFISESGLFAFDGSKIVPLSPDVATIIKDIPKSSLRNAFSWTDPMNRRVYFSISAGPGSVNNQVWAIHVDNGALSKIPVCVTAAAEHKGSVIVGYNSELDASGVNDIGLWGAGTKVYYRNATEKELKSKDIEHLFETRWLTMDNPQSDKTFTRLDVYYVQTGGLQTEDLAKGRKAFDNQVDIQWYTDWDRNIVGGTKMTPCDPNALLWDQEFDEDTAPATWLQREGGTTGAGSYRSVWDEKRVRVRRVNLAANGPLSASDPSLNTSSSDPSGENLTAKCIKLAFSGSGNAGWRIVGFAIYAEDHGIRAEGTDHE